MSGSSLVFSSNKLECRTLMGYIVLQCNVTIYTCCRIYYLPDGCPLWVKCHEFTLMLGLNGNLTNNMWSGFKDYITYIFQVTNWVYVWEFLVVRMHTTCQWQIRWHESKASFSFMNPLHDTYVQPCQVFCIFINQKFQLKLGLTLQQDIHTL